MSCHDRRPDTSAFVDGQLGPEESAHLQQHLTSCSECRDFHTDLLAAHAVFERARRVRLEPPAHIWTRIEARLREKEAAPTPAQRLAALLTVPRYGYATAFTMLVVSLFIVANRQDELARRSLAELDAYRLEVEGNPFFTQPAAPASLGGNPFQRDEQQ